MGESAQAAVVAVMRGLGYDPGYSYIDNYAYTGFTRDGSTEGRHEFAVFRLSGGLLKHKTYLGQVRVGHGEVPDVEVEFESVTSRGVPETGTLEALAAALSARLGREVPVVDRSYRRE